MAQPWVSSRRAQDVLIVVHYAYPIILLFFFLIAFTFRSIWTANTPNPAEQNTQNGDENSHEHHDRLHDTPKNSREPDSPRLQEKKSLFPQGNLFFVWLSLFLAATFVASATCVIAHAIVKREEGWWCGKSVVFYIVGSFFVYCLLLISLIDTKPAPNAAQFASWILGLVMELLLLGASLAVYTHAHEEPKVPGKGQEKLRYGMTKWEAAEIAVDVVRICFLVVLIGLYLAFLIFRSFHEHKGSGIDPEGETSRLLGGDHGVGSANGHAVGYGAADSANHPPKSAGQVHHGWERPTSVPSRNWWEYLKGYSVLFPYLWPAKDRKLQFVVMVCFVIVMLQRVVNLAVIKQVEYVTDVLAGSKGTPGVTPWGAICLYIVFRLLQGGNGLLNAFRSFLWIPVSQYSYREISVAAFEHVHGLSLDFHLGKKTGEVLSALGKGSSINTFLEQVTFQVVPMLVDLGVAIAYFLIEFDAYYALVVAVVTFWYVYLTIRMAQWRAEIRRQMVNADREEDAVKNDSMVSYETVKYFNAEPYEFNRYRDAVQKYQRAEYRVLFSLNLMNVTQNFVFMLGLLVACFIAAYQVTMGTRTVGQFTALLAYMAQLQGPLNFFGTFYRMIQSAMINSERMLELFKEQPTVVDEPDAETLPSCEGSIHFNNVHFSYDERKPALNGMDFVCNPGTTTALVGESGGGKSTVFRLLFRFYNAISGSIQVDGHDVQGITIDSLRSHMGVVPQDTVLFNESLMYNLKYANQDATDEDVHEACRAASIHDKIMTFPDAYNTKVGERGLRLSGGEKQRVAIARTILKNPRIILLDEATAALDTETEQHIQEALTTLGKGRTMLVIAHRLSTITTADQIVVLHEGRVDERGTHAELLAKKGRYASMWRKQVRAQKAAEEAKLLNDRAERLKKEIGDGVESTSHSEDERS